MANYKAGDRNAAGLFIADVISGEEIFYILECPECSKLFIARTKQVKHTERCRDCAQRRQKGQIAESNARRYNNKKVATDNIIPISEACEACEQARQRPRRRRAKGGQDDTPRHLEDLKQFLDPRKMWERMRRQERENREAAEEREQRLIELANGRKSG